MVIRLDSIRGTTLDVVSIQRLRGMFQNLCSPNLEAAKTRLLVHPGCLLQNYILLINSMAQVNYVIGTCDVTVTILKSDNCAGGAAQM